LGQVIFIYHANSNENKINQCNKSFLVKKTMNRRGSGRELVVLLFFFASRGGIRGSKDRVGGVGSLDLNNSPTQ
jgi:hypothetical protein